MSKHKAAKNCKIMPWLSAKKDCKEGRFVQIGNSLLLSPHFQRLSPGAKYLYLCMNMESGGKREFTFPLASATKYGFPATSFRRYCDELAKAGFISWESGANVRKDNIYSFSLDWKLNKT